MALLLGDMVSFVGYVMLGYVLDIFGSIGTHDRCGSLHRVTFPSCDWQGPWKWSWITRSVRSEVQFGVFFCLLTFLKNSGQVLGKAPDAVCVCG